MSAVPHPCIKCDAAVVYEARPWDAGKQIAEVTERWGDKVAEAGGRLMAVVCRGCGKRFVIGVEQDGMPRPRPTVKKRKKGLTPVAPNRYRRRAMGAHTRRKT